MKEDSQTPQLVYGTQADFAKHQEWMELYQVICSHSPDDYGKVIQERGSSTLLYHLSHMRKFLLEWFPIQPKTKVLELGAGAGALTGLFLEKGADTSALEPVEILAKCNAKRNESHPALSLFCGYLESAMEQWEDMKREGFDLAVIAGGLANPKNLMGRAASQQEVLEKLWDYLKPGGQLVVAMENRMGLKYWAGCQEEVSQKYFTGLQGDLGKEMGPRTRGELKGLLQSCGYGDLKFYYPYPDAVFPTMIYSDDYLPRHGELRTNIRNYKEQRFSFFDERKVYDTLLSENLYPHYANAFLVIARKGSI